MHRHVLFTNRNRRLVSTNYDNEHMHHYDAMFIEETLTEDRTNSAGINTIQQVPSIVPKVPDTLS